MKKVILYLRLWLPAFLLWGGLPSLSAQPLTLTISNEAELPGSLVKVKVSASDFTNLLGLQGTISWDDNLLEFDNLISTQGSVVISFNTPLGVINPTAMNKATFVWFDNSLTGVTIPPNTVIMEITFEISGVASIGTVTPVTVDASVIDLFFTDALLAELDPVVVSGGVSVGTSAFPVEMLDFDGNMLDANGVQLAWSTASELENAYFEVQKSANGRDFRAIGEVAGAGTTSEVQSYVFEDRSAMVVSNFYRLKQVDFNGAFSYSDIIEIRADGFLNQLSLFPNPAQHTLSVGLIAADLQATYDLIVRDITGIVVGQQRVAAGAFSERQQLDLSRLSRGVYHLELIRNDGQKYSSKFIKE